MILLRKDLPPAGRRFLLAACGLVLGGCAAPRSPAPKFPVSTLPASFDAKWQVGAQGAAVSENPTWWTAFRDPVLDRLVGSALENDETLRIAGARLREAQADLAAARSGQAPSVNVVAEYQRQHLPPNDRNKDPLVSQYAVAGFEASWDADLSGRIRDLSAAAESLVRASLAARDAVALGVASDVVRTYFQLRGEQAALVQARAARDLQASEVAWTRQRLSAGLANASDLAGARLALVERELAVADLVGSFEHSVHHLARLTAHLSAPLQSELGEAAAALPDLACPPLPNPASLLRQRADLRQAEQELVAAHAISAATRAELLPRLTFGGQLSFFAFGWGLGPTLHWDVLNRTRVHAREAKAGAQADAAFAHYEDVVRNAVAEVEDAVSDLKAARERQAQLETQVAEASALTAFARRRAALGFANRLDIAEAQIAEAKAQASLAIAKATVMQAWGELFRSLGGVSVQPVATSEDSSDHRPGDR